MCRVSTLTEHKKISRFICTDWNMRNLPRVDVHKCMRDERETLSDKTPPLQDLQMAVKCRKYRKSKILIPCFRHGAFYWIMVT